MVKHLTNRLWNLKTQSKRSLKNKSLNYKTPINTTRRMRKTLYKLRPIRHYALKRPKEFIVMGHSDHFEEKGPLLLPKGVEIGHVICKGKKLMGEMGIKYGQLFSPLLDSVARNEVHTDNSITNEMMFTTSPATINTDGIYHVEGDKIIQILHFDDVEDKRNLSDLAYLAQTFSILNGYGDNVMLKIVSCRRENKKQPSVWVVGNKSLKKTIKNDEGIEIKNSISFSEFKDRYERQMEGNVKEEEPHSLNSQKTVNYNEDSPRLNSV